MTAWWAVASLVGARRLVGPRLQPVAVGHAAPEGSERTDSRVESAGRGRGLGGSFVVLCALGLQRQRVSDPRGPLESSRQAPPDLVNLDRSRVQGPARPAVNLSDPRILSSWPGVICVETLSAWCGVMLVTVN